MPEFFGAYSPVPDCIVEDIDREAALVFGAIWRFCQQSPRNVCTASIASIASRAGLGEVATRQRVSRLVARGWLEREAIPGKTSALYDTKRWVTHPDSDTARPIRRRQPQRLVLGWLQSDPNTKR